MSSIERRHYVLHTAHFKVLPCTQGTLSTSWERGRGNSLKSRFHLALKYVTDSISALAANIIINQTLVLYSRECCSYSYELLHFLFV